jgi:N-acetylneuraminic acid mutarotase
VINNKSVASKDSLLLISPWVKKSSCPLDESMDLTQQGFVINNKGYFYAYPYLTFSGRLGEIWEYDPLYDNWNFCCTFPDARFNPFAFAINEKGYIGGGWVIYQDQDFQYVYEFTPENRSWNRVQNFPPIAIDYPIGFSIEEDGYVFGGGDIFEYSQPLDNWSMIGTYEKIPINGDITGFEIDGKIYLKCFSNEIWYYNPSLNSWSKISDFPSKQRGLAIGFSINGNGYTGLGRNVSYIDPELKDLWKYNPDNDTWEEFANFPSVDKHRGNATALVISGKAYIAYDHELWEFNPDF